MFTDPITLVGDSASTRGYALVSIQDGNTVRANPLAPVNAPETMQVKHQLSSRGGVPLDRHLARLDLTKINSLSAPVVASVYMTLEVPRDAAITLAMIKDMRTQLTNFVNTAGNIEKLLNNEP
jgi:hypothetical protein